MGLIYLFMGSSGVFSLFIPVICTRASRARGGARGWRSSHPRLAKLAPAFEHAARAADEHAARPRRRRSRPRPRAPARGGALACGRQRARSRRISAPAAGIGRLAKPPALVRLGPHVCSLLNQSPACTACATVEASRLRRHYLLLASAAADSPAVALPRTVTRPAALAADRPASPRTRQLPLQQWLEGTDETYEGVSRRLGSLGKYVLWGRNVSLLSFWFHTKLSNLLMWYCI